MAGRILVLGAAGTLGRATAEAFRDAGWHVASLARPGSAALVAAGTEFIAVDARDRRAVIAAARGADIVLHTLSPPFAEWGTLALPFAQTALEAARAADATLIFPGNVYNYGAGMPRLLDEDTVMRPTARKGRIRVALETRLRAAAGQGGRVIILRAGAFFGSGRGNWFDSVIVKTLDSGRLVYPGPLDVEREWAYVPDLAAAIVRLAEHRAELPAFAAFGFAGHAVTGRALCAQIMRVTGRKARVRSKAWSLPRLLSPIVPAYRELSELAYLWSVPHRIDGGGLEAAIGPLARTPFDQAVAAALRRLGVSLP